MRAHPRPQPHPARHPLHHPRHKRRAVQLAHLPRHADVLVHERLVVDDHVFVGVGGGALDAVGGAGEEVPPEGVGYELEQGDDAGGAGGGVGGG